MNDAVKSARDKIPWRVVGGMAGLVAILSIMTISQANFQDEDAEANQVLSGGAFGFTDTDGRRILAPVESGLARNMRRFTKAVTAPGKVVDVSFVEARRGSEDGTGRLDPARFDTAPGAIFASDAPLPSGGDVLVATDRFLADRELLAVTPLDHPDCSKETTAALTDRTGRAVAWCKDLARIGNSGRLSLARFEAKGHDDHVTLVYTGAEGTVFRELSPESDGTNAVNTETPLALDRYRPLFAFRSKAGLEVALRRSGDDSDEMDLYRQDGGTFTSFVAASWPRDDG